MTPDYENLPVHQEAEDTTGGTITYANEVIAIISGIAAHEVEGIAGMCTSGGFSDIIGKNRNVTRGVKAEVGTEEVSIDLYAIIEYGQPIQKVASEVQENVRKSIEAMTSLKVVRVDVHVQGVSFEKEKREVQTNLEAVKWQNLPEGSKPKTREERKNEKRRAKEAAQQEEAAKADEPAKVEEPVEEAEAVTEAPTEAEEAAAQAQPDTEVATEPVAEAAPEDVSADAKESEKKPAPKTRRSRKA